MSGTLGDIVQLVLTGTNVGETSQNVHFYRLEDVPTAGYLDGLMDSFETNVLPKYAAVATTVVTFTQLYAKNIFSGDEAFLSPLTPAIGVDGAGSASPSFVAASIKLVRQNARVRHGRKSVGGSSENDFVTQSWTPGYLVKLQTLADALADSLNPGLTDLFAPVIVGRVFEAYDPLVPAVGRYRLPVDQVEMADNWSYFTSAIASPTVSTMNSRKIGHGI